MTVPLFPSFLVPSKKEGEGQEEEGEGIKAIANSFCQKYDKNLKNNTSLLQIYSSSESNQPSDNQINNYDTSPFFSIALVTYLFFILLFLIGPGCMFSKKRNKNKNIHNKNKVFFFEIKEKEKEKEKENDNYKLQEVNILDSDERSQMITLDFMTTTPNSYNQFGHIHNVFKNLLENQKTIYFVTYDGEESYDSLTLYYLFSDIFENHPGKVHFINLQHFHMIIHGEFQSLPKKKFFRSFHIKTSKDALKTYARLFRKHIKTLIAKDKTHYKHVTDEDLYEILEPIQDLQTFNSYQVPL